MSNAKQFNQKKLYFSNRITEALDRIFDHPLTIIEAPMGYGKTTAVREYLSNAGANVLWQSVYENSNASFWNGFVELISKLDGVCSQSLVKIGFPNEYISIQVAVKLIEDIKLPKKTVLVIDDYHLIDSLAINRFIEILIKDKIDNLYIVLATRFAKFQKLEELVLKGYLNHITKETFEFMPNEIMKYYKICGVTISKSEVQQLYSDTEGWISALYMFMLEYIAEGIYTPAKSIYKLIERAVYFPLAEEIKEFVVTLCIFDSFTLNQARYMWEKENAKKFLNELTGNNLFINYDYRSKTYNIHSIFKGFLKEVLEEKEIEYKLNVYRKAAHWFLKNGDCLAAQRYFYECRDFDGILTAVEKDKSNQYIISYKDLLKKYMAQCPQEVKLRHYYAQLIFAMHLFVHKELILFHKTCTEFRINIEKNENLDVDFKKRLLGELELLLSFAEFNDLKKMSAHHKKAWELMNQPTTIYDTGTNWTFGTPSVLSLYYRDSGKLEEHIRDLGKGLPYYYRLTNGHGAGAEYVMEAESCFNKGDFENAEILVQKVLQKSRWGMDENIVLSAKYLQILIAFMNGNLFKTINLMKKMREDMLSDNNYNAIHTVGVCENCIYAYLNQKNKISEELLETDFNNTRINFPAFPFLNIMYGRVLLIRGEYVKLIGSAEQFIYISSIFHNMLGYIYTYIYLAAAYRKIFREDEALSSLKKALDIAMPDKQYMVFVENCDYIEELLKKIAAKGSYREGISRILMLYKTFRENKEQIILNYFTEEKPKLTQRETEIARLAATGITNKEIGKQLYISPNTVKMALRSVYTKLSINSRMYLKQYLDKID